ncbi:MAG: class I SAM-dependent methyltransferase [Rhodocyclaceae bacterium]|nr:class I SAM-dependent methyltransferase [Rhodocyclaceae bacterium]
MNDLIGKEREFLERAASTYRTEVSIQDRIMRRYSLRVLAPYLTQEASILELGCSDGWLTDQLAGKVRRVVSVEGSRTFAEKLRARGLPNVEVADSLFETFETDERFDLVVAGYVLEHVIDARAIIRHTSRFLKDGGVFYGLVPNANALSRQIAVAMGYLKSPYDLTENDLHHGHRRVYDIGSLAADFEASGLTVVDKGGLILKILADFQLDQLYGGSFLTEAHAEAFFELGRQHPDLCGSLYCFGRKADHA